MKKQVLAIVLAVLLIASVIPMVVASAAGNMTIAMTNVTATLNAGDTVKVPVYITENPDYEYGYVRANWDNTALNLESIEYTDLAPAQASAAPITAGASSYKVSFGNQTAPTPFSGTGLAFTMVFTITDTAVAGDYSIIFNDAETEVYDFDINDIPTTATGAVVTLSSGEPETEPTTEPATEPPVTEAGALDMETADVTAEFNVGDTVKVPVTITNNTDYEYGYVTYSWDNTVLELTGIEYTDLAPAQASAAPINAGISSYKVSFGNQTAATPFQGTGEAFKLVFKIADTGYAGMFNIVASDAEVYDFEISEMNATVTNGSVTLNETIHVHNLTKVDEVPAECEKDGTEAYYVCEGCGKMFSDAEGNNEITAPVVIPATGHNWNTGVVTKEPTCTEKGVKTFTCKNNSAHTYTENIDALGHSFVLVPYKAPTATEDGNKAYYVCERCGKWFEDATGKVEITDHSSVIIPATGEPTTEPTTDTPEPVEETTAPVEETTAPVEETTAPVEETTAPVEETTAAVEETTEPSAVEETTAPTEETTNAPVDTPTKPASQDTPSNGGNSPKTGDNGMLFLWITLMGAALIGMTGTVVYTKVKK